MIFEIITRDPSIYTEESLAIILLSGEIERKRSGYFQLVVLVAFMCVAKCVCALLCILTTEEFKARIRPI